MNLIELYRSILPMAGLTSDKDGYVSAVTGDQSTPFMINDQRLVLPTTARLKAGGNVEIFHPLGEHALRPETEILAKFRRCINIRLNYVIACVGESLLTLAASQAQHKSFSPDQLEMLKCIPEASEKTLSSFVSIIKAMGLGNIEKCFVHIYLKPKGKIKDEVYRRAAIVSFPLYEELAKNEKKVYGVTITNKDRISIMGLLTYIFSRIAQPQSYDHGSNSDIAPFLTALLKSAADVGVGEINAVIDLFGPIDKTMDALRYEDDWLDVIDSLDQFNAESRMIPIQGNTPAPIAAAPALYQPPAMGYPQPAQTSRMTAPPKPTDADARLNLLRGNSNNNQYGSTGGWGAPAENTPRGGGPAWMRPEQSQWGQNNQNDGWGQSQQWGRS